MGVRGPLSRDSGHLARDAVVCNGASGGCLEAVGFWVHLGNITFPRYLH